MPTETYVDPSIAGNSGAGTIGDPYGDLQYALDTMTRDSTNGDRINIQDSADEVLAAAISLATYGTPTVDAPLIFQGYTSAAGDGGIGGISGNGSLAVYSANAAYTHWVDLHLHNCGSANVLTIDVQSFVYNCEIDNTTGNGIHNPDDNTHIIGNYLHNIGGTGIQLGDFVTIMYNHFENGTNDFSRCIHMWRQNIVMFNVYDLDGATDGHTCQSGADGTVVMNNSIYSNAGTGSGIQISNAADEGIIILNNIIEGFSGTGGIGIETASGSSLYLLGFNAFYNNATNESLSGVVLQDLGNDQALGASPFTNAAADDFTVGTSVRALAFPTSNYGGLGVRSYLDIGALQRQEPAGGSTTAATGGIRLGHTKI